MITWLGHATIRIDTGDTVIFFDPYKMKEWSKAHVVILSHEHFDHCSVEDLKKVVTKQTIMVGPPKVKGVMHRMSRKFHVMTAGDKIEVRGIPIEAMPAYNTEKPFHLKSAGGLGYILEIDGKRIYYAGDTDVIPEMQNLNVHTAILPVGGMYTMDAEDAARAYKITGAEVGIPMHYGSDIGSGADGEHFKRLISLY